MALAYTEISHNKWKTALLMVLFTAFVLVAGFAIAEFNQPGAGLSGLMVAAVASLGWTGVSYFSGDKIALMASRAQPIEKKDNPELYRIVENLAIAAGLPTPKVHIISSPALNAFATGRNPQKASVAVTTGLLDRLEKKELEGVLAHELSHIGNYDTRLMMVVMALAGVIMILTDFFWRWSFFHGGNRNRSGGGRAQGVIMLIGLLLLIFAPIFATLIKLAISRRREYLADASGALLTRYPEGLALALEKISRDPQELQTATKGTAHLYISNPFRHGSWAKAFSTHPPIQDRIAKLRGMGV